MYSANEPINQNVNVSFTAEDKFTNVAEKVSKVLQNLQLGTLALNLGFGALNKATNQNIKSLNTLSGIASKLGVILDKTLVPQAIAKGLGQITDGLRSINKQVSQLELGLKKMEASGYSTQLIEDFKQLGEVLQFNINITEQFALQATTAYTKFAKAKSEVEVLFAPGDEFVKNLSNNIQKLVNEDLKNAVTSIDALAASYQAASALFLDAGENASVMSAGLKLAKAGSADAGATMKVLTQTIRAYNMSAGDADKVSAALNETIKLGITSLPELANGFAQTAVVAKEAGIKLEELSGAVAALTLKGSSTPSALTGIESLSRVIINKTPEATKALQQLRDESNKPIKFDVTEIKAKGLTKALQDLNKATNGNAQLLAEIIPESLAYSTALGLMANNAEQLSKNVETIKPVIQTGAAARKALNEVFGISINNDAVKFEAIINRITESFIKLGEQLSPFFNVGVKALENMVNFLSKFSNENKELIANLIIAQLTFKTTIGVAETFAKTILGLVGTFVGLRLTITLFQGQLGKTVDTISGLIKVKAGLIPIAKQLIGIDQTHLLLEKKVMEANKSKLAIMKELATGENGRIQSIKELIGWDKEYIITEKDAIDNSEKRKKLLDSEIENNKAVIKAKKELQTAEENVNKQKQLSIDLADKLENNAKKQIALDQELIKARQNVNSNSGDVSANRNLNLLEQEKIKLLKEEENLKRSRNTNNEVLNKNTENLNKKQIELDEKRKQLSEAMIPLNEKKLEIGRLELQQLKEQNVANALTAKAEDLRRKAKTDTAKSSQLLANAEKIETAAKIANEKVTTTTNLLEKERITLKKLSIAASREQAVADGTLLKVQGLLKSAYVTNNFLNRILFTQIKIDIPTALAVAQGATTLFGKVFTGTMAVATGVVKTLKGAIVSLSQLALPFLSSLAPMILPAIPVLILLNDQFNGLGKTIKDLNKLHLEQSVNLEKNIDKLYENYKKINVQQVARLENLRKERAIIEENAPIHEKFFDSISYAFSNLGREMGRAKNITYLLGSAFENLNKIRLSGTITNLRKDISVTQEEIKYLIEDNKKFKEGLTNIPELDKLIEKGEALNTDQLVKLQQNFEVNKKRSENIIKINDDTIKVLNEQLQSYDQILTKQKNRFSKEQREKYEALSPEEQKKVNEKILNDLATDTEKDLAQKRSQLEGQNELLKRQISNYADNYKTLVDWQKNKNIILKQIADNEIKEEDRGLGSNASEIRLNKSLKASEQELEKYGKRIIAAIDGTNQYIEDGVTKTLNITEDLGEEALKKLEERVQMQIDNINQLYEFGSISAEEAQSRIDKILNTQLKGINGFSKSIAEIFKNENILGFISDQQNLLTKANKDVQDKLEYQANLYKKQLDNNLITTEEANSKLREIQEKQLEEQQKSLEKQLELATKSGSKTQQQVIQRQLDLLNQDRFALEIKNDIEEKNEKLKIESDKNEQLLKINEAYASAKIGNQTQLFKVISDLELKQFENSKKQLENQLAVMKTIGGVDPKKIKDIENQITLITAQESAKRIEISNKEIEMRYDKQQKRLNKESALIQLEREKFIKSEEQTIIDLDNIQKKNIINKQKEISERIKLSRKNKQDTADLEKELVDLQLSYQQIITKALEREYQKRIKLLNNNTTSQTQELQKILNTISSTTASLQEEEKIINSRNSLTRDQLQYEEAKLQLQLRTTYDIEKRATLELKQIELKQKNLSEEQKMEKQSFIFQQKIVDLGLRRQEIELNIKQIQLDSNKKLLELDLQRAINQKVAQEEIESIQLKLSANKEESKILESSRNLLIQNRENQKEITENNLKQLEYKQKIAKEGGLLDLEIAKQNIINSQYEKQAKQAQLNLQLVELNSNKQIKNSEYINKLEERRLKILNDQLQIEETNSSNVQKRFGILSNLEQNEKRKQRLQEFAAKQELLNLDRKQKIETQILDMQIKQNRAALERQKIEQQVAELRLEAELKIAEAEKQKILADKTKSKEERDAAILSYNAKAFELQAKQYERNFIAQKEQDLIVEEKMQRDNLLNKQRNDRLDKSLAYAQSTRTKRDDNFIRNMLRYDLSPYMDRSKLNIDPNIFGLNSISANYKESNIPNFNEYLNKSTSRPEIGIRRTDNTMNNIVDYSKDMKSTGINNTKESKNIVINFNNTNDIKITNDNPTKELAQEIEQTTYKSLYNVFRKINTDLGNN